MSKACDTVGPEGGFSVARGCEFIDLLSLCVMLDAANSAVFWVVIIGSKFWKSLAESSMG